MASNMVRITGMNSGLDTETIIQELVKAKRTKVDKIKKDNTKLEWKQDAWKDLNKEIKSLFSGTVSNLRYTSAYKKKITSASNSAAVNVITGAGAMNSVQNLSIKKLAKSGYLTGQEVKTADGSKASASTLLKDLQLKDAAGNPIEGLADINGEGSFTITSGGKSTEIKINADTTIGNLVSQLNGAGVSANFDAKNQRLFIGAASSGEENDFRIMANDSIGFAALSLAGINVDPSAEESGKTANEYGKLSDYYNVLKGQSKDDAINAITSDTTSEIYKMLKAECTDKENPDFDAAYDKLMAKLEFADSVANSDNSKFYSKDAVRLEGSDAEIELNGATFKSATNNVEVNGLTFECKAIADNITITTTDDTEGVYDVVKDFLKKYNELAKKIDTLYNADSAKGYEPLTDDEKDAMSDKEIEKWEDKIKGAILKGDSTLGNIFSSMKDIMAQGFEVNGKKLYMADFGISTANYFEAEDHERALYHIDGDKDDTYSSGNEDKLKTMIATDPDSVVSFFTQLSNALYDKLSKLSASTTTSSFGSFYEDKQMKTDLSSYATKIAEAEAKLTDYEDKYYAKFSKMESALAAMDSKSNYLSGLFG